MHRRLLRDDGFGVGEPLNEMAFGKGLIARGTTYFVFGSKSQSQKPSMKAMERFIQLQILLPVMPLFSDASQMNDNEWKSNYNHKVRIFTILNLPNQRMFMFENLSIEFSFSFLNFHSSPH